MTMTNQPNNKRQNRAAIIGAVLLVASGIIAIASSSTHLHGSMTMEPSQLMTLSMNNNREGMIVASPSMRGSTESKQESGKHNTVRQRRRQEEAVTMISTARDKITIVNSNNGMEDCSSGPWHATDDGNEHTCTNSYDYPEGWETMEGYLFQNAMDCCAANFPDVLECHLVDACEDLDGNDGNIMALSDNTVATTVSSSFEETTSTEATATTHASSTADPPQLHSDGTEAPERSINPYPPSYTFATSSSIKVTNIDGFVEETDANSSVSAEPEAVLTTKATMTTLDTTTSTEEAATTAASSIATDFAHAKFETVEHDITSVSLQVTKDIILIESNLQSTDMTALPWDYGSPTPMWEIDPNVSLMGDDTPSITNIPQAENGANADLTLRFRVNGSAGLRCIAKIETSMPFDQFVVLVDGEVRDRDYYQTGLKEIVTWLQGGDHTVVFRVQDNPNDYAFDRGDYGDVHGSGRVWLDHCSIILPGVGSG